MMTQCVDSFAKNVREAVSTVQTTLSNLGKHRVIHLDPSYLAKRDMKAGVGPGMFNGLVSAIAVACIAVAAFSAGVSALVVGGSLKNVALVTVVAASIIAGIAGGLGLFKN